MPTTSNFGWTTPADTDYVKDGALAIRTLGNGIDTSLVDLKGGTTGQILSKASNTDLDYTWINNDQGDITAVNAGTGISVTNPTGPTPTVAIDSTVATLTGSQTLTNKTIDASSNTLSNIALSTATTGTLTETRGGTNQTTYTTGDLLYASGADTLAKRAIGTTGQVLTVSSGVPTWATPTAATPTYVGVSASKSGNQSIANSTDTVITFDVEQFDTDAFHNNSTNTSRFTVPSGKGGKYLVNATCQFADSATGVRTVSLLKNGNMLLEMEQISASSAGTTRVSGGGVFDLAVSDYVEMRVWQNSGGALNVNGGFSYTTTVQMTYLGA